MFSPSGDTAFAIGGTIGLRRSINGGATFTSFGSGLTTGTRTHFDLAKSNPAFMYAAVYSSGVTIYKTTDSVSYTHLTLPTSDLV